MPNYFAYAMLLIWPLVAVALFRKLTRASAMVWTLLAGYLLLPSGTEINLPMLPALDKISSPVLAAFFLCLAGAGLKRGARASRMAPPAEEQPGWLPRSWVARILLTTLVLSPLPTALLNQDPLIYGPTFLRGMVIYDALSMAQSQAIMILPLLMGRRLLARPEETRSLLIAMTLAGLAYTLPILIEIRMSPQMHVWFYGFFPHSFLQTMRFDGWRPQVFLTHGLSLALLLAMILLAAMTLPRLVPKRESRNWKLSAAWLGLILILCKSVGAVVSVLLAAPFILFSGRRVQLGLAMLVATVTLFYPAIRSLDLVPTETLVSMSGNLSGERAGSLKFRFDNEDLLLAKADQRPIFGWGSWGRNRVYETTPGWALGRSISVTDGLWLITFGVYGWVGYLAQFGLLTLPVLALYRQRHHPDLTLETTALCLILSINYLDLLLNSSLTPITWLLAGAILGRAEMLATNPVAARNARPFPRPSVTLPGRPAPDPQRPVSPRPSPPRQDPGRPGPVRPGLGGRPETSSRRFPR